MTATPHRIAVVSAGLSNPSSTRLLADRLAAATVAALRARGEDATVEVVELRDHARDLADHLTTGFAAAALQAAIDTVVGADAVIAVTPIFTASYSGLFKTFFDVIDKDALVGTPVLLAATAGTARHSLVVEFALRPLFAYLRAVPVPDRGLRRRRGLGAAAAPPLSPTGSTGPPASSPTPSPAARRLPGRSTRSPIRPPRSRSC